MSTPISKPLLLKVRCPLCSTVEEVLIKPEYFKDSLTGIVRIPIEHREPSPHMIIIDIDQHGFIRGSYLYRKKISPTTIKIGEVISNLGVEKVAILLYYLLMADHIFLKGKSKELNSAKKLVVLLDEESKLTTSPSKETISLDIEKTRKPKATLHPLRSIIIHSNGLSTDDAKAEWIRGEYQRLKKALNELVDVLSMDRKWTLDELCESLASDVNKDDLRLLLDILEDRGMRISNKIRDAEYKVKSLFI